jgi:hypothetical protein
MKAPKKPSENENDSTPIGQPVSSKGLENLLNGTQESFLQPEDPDGQEDSFNIVASVGDLRIFTDIGGHFYIDEPFLKGSPRKVLAANGVYFLVRRLGREHRRG